MMKIDSSLYTHILSKWKYNKYTVKNGLFKFIDLITITKQKVHKKAL